MNSLNGLNSLSVSILLMTSYYITNNIFFNDKFYLNENWVLIFWLIRI